MPGAVLYLLLTAVIAYTHGNTLKDGTSCTADAEHDLGQGDKSNCTPGDDRDLEQKDETNCTAAAEHDLGQGDVTTILTVSQDLTTGTTNLAYVKPKEGFEGVSVEVQDGDKSQDAWFPADETCLPASGSWWKFSVRVILITEQTLSFRLYCGSCSWSCSISDTRLTSMESILVKGHGPSSWSTKLENCSKPLLYETPRSSDDVCEKPPTPTPTSTITPQGALNPSQTAPNSTPEATNQTKPSPPEKPPVMMIGGAVAGGLVLLLLLVVAVCLRHRCRSEASHSPPTATEAASPVVHDTRNSLYEPLSAFQQQPAAAPSAHENQVQVIENELYESVEIYQQNQAFDNQ